MKILWLTNKLIPEVESALSGAKSNVFGGWLTTVFNQICQDKTKQLTVMCGGAERKDHGEEEHFSWYSFSETGNDEVNYNNQIEQYFVECLKATLPDIIHIWGTEYPHTLEMVNAASSVGLNDKVVISIQGVASACQLHSTASIPTRYLGRRSIHDFLRKTSVTDLQKNFNKRGRFEVEAIKKVKHIIGRTDFDRACAININKSIKYHFCNETLRNEFYSSTWTYEKCRKHSIFVSQSSSPIKGFHILLKALPEIIEDYPDTHVFVAGNDPRSISTIKDRIKQTTYGKYLNNLLSHNSLSQHVTFLGIMTAEQMKEQYLNSNVFVSASSIENSPNSVGEAMLLGVPVVASDVGGTRNMLCHGIEGITYQWDAPYMLEYWVKVVFANAEIAKSYGKMARAHALNTHDADANYKQLMSIYYDILTGE